MCGIIGFSGSANNEAQLRQMANSLKHRGPDAQGFYHNGTTFLGHCRLSILDLSTNANQPFLSEDQRYVVVFNGEIYNFKSIRADLELNGFKFRTNSDTEVLLNAFILWGISCIEHFIGMFAFSIHDTHTGEIYLCRDRLGVKPLYYSTDEGLIFASELKAILPLVNNKELDTLALREYFRVGMISGERSIYKSIRKLPAGSYLHYKDKKASITRYWSMKSDVESKDYSDAEWKDKVHEMMIDAFRLRMVSDVPVGVFLSGGIDSSLVTSILQKHHGNIHTFTIGFDDPRYDEAPFARQVAEHLKTEHTEFELQAKDAFDLMEHFYDIYDEPFADSSGIPSTLVSRLAAQKGIKVVLSADGGDELFAGYSHYPIAINRWEKWQKVPYPLRSVSGKVLDAIYNSGVLKNIYSGNIEHRVAAVSELLSSKALLPFFESQIANQTNSELNRLLYSTDRIPENTFAAKEAMTQLMLLDFNVYLTDDLLVKMDRATMYNSIEGREPFLDHRLVSLAYQMPVHLKYRNGKGKYILREILADYIPREIFERPKKGFSIPIFKWFSNEMSHMFAHYLTEEKLNKVPVLNTQEVLHEYKKYRHYVLQGKEYNIEKIWRILSFLMWWDKWHEEL